MMSVLKGAMLLLLLAAVSTNAAPEDCDGLNKTVPAADLHKVYGDWVLDWAVSGSQWIFMKNLTNSHVELRPLPGNSTFSYIERNRFHDGSCTVYNSTLQTPSDDNKLDVVVMTEEKDGVVTPFEDSAKVEFLETCPECMMMVYRGNVGGFLLHYRREGQHQDLKKNSESHSDFQKLAGCLGLLQDGVFIHEGADDFCHRPSPLSPPSPPSLPSPLSPLEEA